MVRDPFIRSGYYFFFILLPLDDRLGLPQPGASLTKYHALPAIFVFGLPNLILTRVVSLPLIPEMGEVRWTCDRAESMDIYENGWVIN